MSTPAPDPRSGLCAPTLPSPPTSIPWLGLVAVLIGAFISTLNGRLSTFGLADIRGAVGAGFDEGAWIPTAQTTAQMFVTLIAVWMGAAYGPRRVLIWASLSFAVISLLIPYSASLSMLLTLQFLGGLASGFFVPLTLSFILLSMPPRYWAFGVAIYALNLELSPQHISLSRGVLRRASLLAMDLLAKRPARLAHVAVPAARHRHQADHSQTTVRPVWSCNGWHRARGDLRGTRSGQSARLA